MWNRRDPRDPSPATVQALDASDIRDAYRQGRRDGRSEHRRHPVVMTLLMLTALAGAALLALAAVNGSFENAGAVADHNLAVAADRAEPVVRQAAADAGQAVRDAATPDRPAAPAR